MGAQGFDTTRTVIPRDGTPYSSQMLSFYRGVNNSMSDELIAPDELSDARNMIPDTLNAGVLINRPGVVRWLGDAQGSAFTSIYDGRNGNFFTGTNTIKEFLSDTNLDATLSHTSAPDWTTFNSIDIFVNGTDAPRQIADGPVVSALAGAPPTFKYIQSYGQRVYGAGHDFGSLRWTSTGTTTSWGVLNELFVTRDEHDDITGLAKFGDALMVFCEHSFHRIRHGTTDTDITVAFSNFAEGCTSHRSIVVCPYGIFWWSESGLCWSKDGFSFDLPFLRKVPNTLESLNKAQYGKVHGTYDVRRGCLQYYFCRGASATEDFSIWYYPPDERFGRPESVWLHEGDGVRMGASGSATTDYSSQVYLGSASQNGYFYIQSGNVDSSMAIACRIDTKRDFTDYGMKATKKVRFLTPLLIATDTASIDYAVILDNEISPDRTWTIVTEVSAGIIFDSTVFDTGVFSDGEHYDDRTLGYERNYHKIKHRFRAAVANGLKIRGVINSGTLVNA